MSESTSTLAHTEKILAPLVWLVWVVCTLAGIALLWPQCEPLALATWLVLTGSNVVFFVRHRRVSVGMMPPAVASLAPAAASALTTKPLAPAVRGACLCTLVVACGIICLFAFWFARLHATYTRRSHVDDDAVIIVLGGAVVDGRPRPTLALRLDVAFELTVDHPQRTLILTGGPLANGPGTEAEAMARYLIDKGLPSQQLLLEQQARNTRENISNSCVLATRESLSGQRCVLTSDYHLYRAVREGRAIGVELTPIPAPVPLPGRLQQWSREVLTILAAR